MVSNTIIQTLKLDFHAGSPTGNGNSIERQVNDWKDHYLLSVLQSWMDEVDTEEIHVRMEQLEIQVSSSSANWQEDVLRQVKQQLMSKIREEQSFRKFSVDYQPAIIKKEIERQGKGQTAQRRSGIYNRIKNSGASGNTDELIEHILHHGTLPWWSGHLTIAAIRERINEWIHENEMDKKNWFVFNTERLRVSKLFAGQLLLKFFNKYNTQSTERLTELYRATQKFKATEEEMVSFNGYIEEFFLKMLAFDSAASFSEAINKTAKPGEHSTEKMNAGIKMHDQLQPVVQSVVNKTGNENKEDARPLADRLRTYTNTQEEAIFIANAGAVLFAPFLPALFAKLDLLNKGELKDVEACLSLIHFAATGINDAGEFELVLPKILCGLHPSQPAFYKPLNREQQEEVTNMIESVITYWATLRNTSQQTLRETFFSRHGKLYRSNDSWQLLVEQNAVDVLLQSVSWNFSMIRFSWMPWMLITEWNY